MQFDLLKKWGQNQDTCGEGGGFVAKLTLTLFVSKYTTSLCRYAQPFFCWKSTCSEGIISDPICSYRFGAPKEYSNNMLSRVGPDTWYPYQNLSNHFRNGSTKSKTHSVIQESKNMFSPHLRNISWVTLGTWYNLKRPGNRPRAEECGAGALLAPRSHPGTCRKSLGMLERNVAEQTPALKAVPKSIQKEK